MNHSRPKIFTWHVHGSYLYYLSQGNYDLYIPVDKEKSQGHIGKGSIPFPDNVIEVEASQVKDLELDCILYQSGQNYLHDQFKILSPAQLKLPRIYLEHDPPRNSPTDTRHIVEDQEVTIVHVTDFNDLMWDSNASNTVVIDHGVITDPAVSYSGELEKGIVVINNLVKRGRRLGSDIFLQARKEIPLDIIGMGSEEIGGLGEVPLPELPSFIGRYRFFFNPIRYTSLGLSICEAMMIGMPIVGLATTELVTVIRNGISGYIHTQPEYLIMRMKKLLADRDLAQQMGQRAKRKALQRFNIDRFTADWEDLFRSVISGQLPIKNRSLLSITNQI